MQLFVAVDNDWKLLIIVIKRLALDVYKLLDLTPLFAL